MSIYGFPYTNRPDLSPYIYHLCGNHFIPGAPKTAAGRLAGILDGHSIKAFRPFGAAASEIRKRITSGQADADVLKSQNACCFTETPLGPLAVYFENLNRQQQFAPYGICIGRSDAMHSGAHPIWYSDEHKLAPFMSLLSDELDRLAKDREKGPVNPLAYQTLVMAPRFELVKRGEHLKKTFWWEREWRCVRDEFPLPVRGAVLCPKAEQTHFQTQLDQHAYLNKWITIHLDDSVELNLKKLEGAIPESNVTI